VLERKQPPTFDMLVEIRSWEDVLVYNNVAEAVDALLRGELPQAEQRHRDPDGTIRTEMVESQPPEGLAGQQAWGVRLNHQRHPEPSRHDHRGRNGRAERHNANAPRPVGIIQSQSVNGAPAPVRAQEDEVSLVVSNAPSQRIYAYGLSRDKVEKAIASLKVAAVVVRDISEATMVMTIKNYYRKGSARLRHAEERQLPIYVLRSSTAIQIERQLLDIFDMSLLRNRERPASSDPEINDAMLEAETAIQQVLNGERNTVELTPQGSIIRKLQHQMAERYNIQSESRGREPFRRVKVSR